MSKQIIKTGFTNISYIENGYFVQEKKLTGFNHKINYSLLKQFDFVPKLIKETKDVNTWEFIEGHEPSASKENLIQIVKDLKILHNSKLPFPPSNHAARVKGYRAILKERNINIPALNDFYRSVNQTLSKMDKTKPLHNDMWLRNLVQTKEGKIYFCDWEYATLGDVNFELAYFIESAQLNKEQEKWVLDEYEDYDPVYLIRHKILVNYLVVLWAHSQTTLPFDTTYYEKRMYELNKELIELRGE